MADCKCCAQTCFEKLCMQKVPIFSMLSRDELTHIASLIRHREYQRGETLVFEGDSLHTLVVIHEGSVKAFKNTADGREQILYVFTEGDFFGERDLFGKQRSACTVEALERVKTCSFSKEDFHKLLYLHSNIAVKIIEELEERLTRMENAMQSMGVRSLDGRIGALLLDFAGKYGETVPEGILIRLPLSREGMANFLGIARETVSRKLGQLETENVIRSVGNRSILLLNERALKESSGFPE